LPEAILSGKPYPVKAVLVHGLDPVLSLPNGEQFGQALKQVPLVISFSPFLNETAALADLILPDCSSLEKWQETSSPPTFPYPLFSVSPPAVAPVHPTRDTADVLLDIAHGLGGSVAAALPHAKFEEVLRADVEKIFAAQAGYVFATKAEETWNRLLERSGWWAPTYSTADELWAQMKERGGWWEPTYYYGEWDRVLRTRSQRFEFFSQKLLDWAVQHPNDVMSAGFDPGDDRACLPHQPPLPNPPPGFPLLLLPFEVLPLTGGTGAHLPLLQQISGVNVFERWESWLEINPATAAESGLVDREWVWVESPRGRVRVRVRFYAGVRPGVVHLPIGYGQTQGSAWACRGVNPLNLIATERDSLTGLLHSTRTFVRVLKG
jgi:anaerobic selenocysteine-containing dehydrogenase